MDQPIELDMSPTRLFDIKHGRPDAGEITRFCCNLSALNLIAALNLKINLP